MHTFAQIGRPTQQAKSVSSTLHRRGHSGQSHEIRSYPLLQRTNGNHVVQQLLQANTEERENDSLISASPRLAHDFSQIPAYANTRTNIQPKLKVSAPGDSYEQEANCVADQVMRMPQLHLQRACAIGGEGPGCQAKQPGGEHKLLQTKRIQTNNPGEIAAPPIVHEVMRSPGQSLDSGMRIFIERRFGHDFSHVRVHTDSKAVESAREVSALAYSVGRDIVFGAGQYTPRTRNGQRLLAHELTHVVQERGNQALRCKEDNVDPRDCPNAHEAIMSWGYQQAVAWIKKKNQHKGRAPTILERCRRVWKTFNKLHEVDIDIHFRRPHRDDTEHVKWRVQPIQKNKQWILKSTITDWWDGHR